MRYLITGGAGFIGSHLVERLVAENAAVVVLDDFSTGRRENLEAFLDRITLIEGSITDPATCVRAVRGADYVLHQAALGSVPRSIENPLRTHEVNVTGTLNILVAARDAGVRRVVCASSSSIYGDTPTLPKREDMPPRPRSPYAVSKLAAESYTRAFGPSYGLETLALRYFNVYGPRQDPSSQYAAVIPLFITAALADRPPTIFGDGEQTRDFTFVGDVVEANLRATTAPPEGLGRVFNVGGGRRTSINELWALIAAETGASVEPRHDAGRQGDVRDSLADVQALEETTGFRPATGIAEGLQRTVEWYRGRVGGHAGVAG